MRFASAVALLGLCFAFSCPVLSAQQSIKIPYVSSPLVPGAAAPGGPPFTLTVNGANFESADVVLWNGSPLQTTYKSATQLMAAVPAANIASPGTAFVTVSDAIGGLSNFVYFPVTTPTTSLAFNRSDLTATEIPDLDEPTAIAVMQTGPGTPTLAITNEICAADLECIMEHSSISFYGAGPSFLFAGEDPVAIGIADFTGNGSQDLITLNRSGTYSISLASNLEVHNDYPLPTGSTPSNQGLALGDWNGDGYTDFAVTSSSGLNVFLSNGDGTFATPVNYIPGIAVDAVATGDFNGDGKLDLAVAGSSNNTVYILLGNGDGTFQAPVTYAPATNEPIAQIVSADFNGDGKPDLAIGQSTGVSILIGNGDGTFQPAVNYPAGTSVVALIAGDFNGDGKVDLAEIDNLCTDSGCPASGSVNVLVGNGDGTFQSPLNFATAGYPLSIAAAEIEYSGEENFPVGRPGFAVVNDNLASDSAFSVSVFSPIGGNSVNALPTISSISPNSAEVNSGALTLTINGTNFLSTSSVEFGAQPLVTTYVSSTQLSAVAPASDVSTVGQFAITVMNPSPGGGSSTAENFDVDPQPPSISSLNPPSVVVGGPTFTLEVVGQNFVNGTVANINDAQQETTFVNATELTISVPATEITSQGSLSITVTDPQQSGGETSGAVSLQILPTNAQPTLGSLSPRSATAGSSQFTLTITGTSFTANSIVTFGSATVSSGFVSATELQAAIPASLIATAGTPLVTVMNPGGIPSVASSFIVNNPIPALSNITPATVPAGSAATMLNVVGSNFNSSSKVMVNGAARASTYQSANTLQAALLASDFAQSASLSITVNNPAPGGGTSAPALTLTVADYNVNPQTPSQSVAAGNLASYTLVVNPSNGTLNGAVKFAVASGLPAGTTPTFSPSATVSSGSGMAMVTLSITTTPHSAASSGGAPQDFRWPRTSFLFGSGLVLAMLAWIGLRMPVGLRAPRLLLAAFLFAAAGVSGCGGGGSSSGVTLNPATGTPAGTYSIVVTATSGAATLSTNLTLTVM